MIYTPTSQPVRQKYYQLIGRFILRFEHITSCLRDDGILPFFSTHADHENARMLLDNWQSIDALRQLYFRLIKRDLVSRPGLDNLLNQITEQVSEVIKMRNRIAHTAYQFWDEPTESNLEGLNIRKNRVESLSIEELKEANRKVARVHCILRRLWGAVSLELGGQLGVGCIEKNIYLDSKNKLSCSDWEKESHLLEAELATV